MTSSGTKLRRSFERETKSGTENPSQTQWSAPTAAPPKRRLRKLSLRTGIIYGPVQSRRLGLSLGINLLPTTYKLCSFDCIYCQYGWTKKATMLPTDELNDLPSPEQVYAALGTALTQVAQNELKVDSITICGNGEPTLYPHLRQVIETAKQMREQYQPQAQLAILSNSGSLKPT